MIPLAVATLAGICCLPATYTLTREGSIPLAILIVILLGATGGATGSALRDEDIKPRRGLLVMAFVLGAVLSEAVGFAYYYITYGYKDLKLVVGISLSVIEFAVISAIGSAALLVAALLVQSRITRRSRGRGARGAPLS